MNGSFDFYQANLATQICQFRQEAKKVFDKDVVIIQVLFVHNISLKHTKNWLSNSYSA
jgi:hypothetical protein